VTTAADPAISETAPVPKGLVDPRWVTASAIVLILGTLFFYNLGHYYLWDDEAYTALYAQAILRTGDTSAVLGHNIVAFRNGIELQGLKNRLSPPLPYYIAAPFIGLLGSNAFASRLPFALFGLLSVWLVLYWLWKANAVLRTWILVGLGACGNVSLILYTRQARYYALITFLALLITFLYVHWDGRRGTLLGLSVSALALLATHYLAYAGLAFSIGVDYLTFGRRRKTIKWQDLFSFAGLQILGGSAIIWIWNPFNRPITGYRTANWIDDKATLFWWHIRDLNASEFGAVVLLVAAPIVYVLTKRQNSWLVRLPLAVVMYCLAVSVISPQPVGWTAFADIRYVVATIPALIFLGVTTLEGLPFCRDWPRYVVALLIFYTNILNVAAAGLVGGPVGPMRSTLREFAGELRHPLPSPYAAAADWINFKVAPGKTILVLPDFAAYPLMFHAPHAVYGWQLDQSLRAQYPMLPDIHFQGAVLPDYIVAFGESVRRAHRLADSLEPRGARYVQRA
jgi:hypothetical protein